MQNDIVLAAYFSKKGLLTGQPEVEITEINRRTGETRWMASATCAGMREARKVAAAHNATPWNF